MAIVLGIFGVFLLGFLLGQRFGYRAGYASGWDDVFTLIAKIPPKDEL